MYTLIGASYFRRFSDACWTGDDGSFYIARSGMSFNNKRESHNARAIIEQECEADTSKGFVIYYDVIGNSLTSHHINDYSATSSSELGAIMMGLPIIGVISHDLREGMSNTWRRT